MKNSVKILSKKYLKIYSNFVQVFCLVSVLFNCALITRQLTQIESELRPNMPHCGTNSILNLLVAFSCCCVVFHVDFAGLFLLCAKKKFDHNFKHRFKCLATASASAFTFALAWHLFVAGLRIGFGFGFGFGFLAMLEWFGFISLDFGFLLESKMSSLSFLLLLLLSSRRGVA